MEPVFDLIGFQYMQPDTVANPYVDTTIGDMNVIGTDDGLFQSADECSNMLSSPTYWQSEQNCPLASAYNSQGQISST